MEPIFRPGDDHWVKTKTDRYLYAANKLWRAARELKQEPKPADYRMVLDTLVAAVKEQLVVFARLRTELVGQKFVWALPPFAVDPRVLLGNAHQGLAAGQSWQMMGRDEATAPATFKLVSDAFLMLLDCNALMRKDLGWKPPHQEEPPPSGPNLPPPPLSPVG